jgi:hypothetical protein
VVRLFFHRTGFLSEPPSVDEDTPDLIDLSKATKLKAVAFRFGSLMDSWVAIESLKTITLEHRDLRQISIYISLASSYILQQLDVIEHIGPMKPDSGWSDLDRLLAQLWESHSIRCKVMCPRTWDDGRAKAQIMLLLPQTTKEGTSVVEYFYFEEL